MLNINDHYVNSGNTKKNLHQLLSQVRTVTSSKRRTIYFKGGKILKFFVFQNDSLSSTKIIQIEKDNEFLKLPLEDRQFGLLQLTNKVKGDKLTSSYDSLDVGRIKIASNFITYTISKIINYKNSLEKKKKTIATILNYEYHNKVEESRLNNIFYQCREFFFELSLNNSSLDLKVRDTQSDELQVNKSLVFNLSEYTNYNIYKDLNITLDNINYVLKSKFKGIVLSNNGLIIKIILNNQFQGITNE